MIISKWTKRCQGLYNKMGVYSVYHQGKTCIYVGKSTDLGKRILRFFNPRTGKRLIEFKDGDITACLHLDNIHLEVSVIYNVHKLDSFERTMIAIKKPMYNKLLNYK